MQPRRLAQKAPMPIGVEDDDLDSYELPTPPSRSVTGILPPMPSDAPSPRSRPAEPRRRGAAEELPAIPQLSSSLFSSVRHFEDYGAAQPLHYNNNNNMYNNNSSSNSHHYAMSSSSPSSGVAVSRGTGETAGGRRSTYGCTAATPSAASFTTPTMLAVVGGTYSSCAPSPSHRTSVSGAAAAPTLANNSGGGGVGGGGAPPSMSRLALPSAADSLPRVLSRPPPISANAVQSASPDAYHANGAYLSPSAPADSTTGTGNDSAATTPGIATTSSTTAASPSATATATTESSRTNLIVYNIAANTTEDTLHQLFDPFGQVVSCAVMRDIHTGASLGTAFVRFAANAEARRALFAFGDRSKPVYMQESKPLIVQWARRQHDDTPVGEARKKIMKLFVRNVPLDCHEELLEDFFSQFGCLRQVTLHKDTAPVEDPAMERLIAFVIYAEEGAAERAATAVHNTKPFASCYGIPIMVKLAESGQRRRMQKDAEASAAVSEADIAALNAFLAAGVSGSGATTAAPASAAEPADGSAALTSTTTTTMMMGSTVMPTVPLSDQSSFPTLSSSPKHPQQHQHQHQQYSNGINNSNTAASVGDGFPSSYLMPLADTSLHLAPYDTSYSAVSSPNAAAAGAGAGTGSFYRVSVSGTQGQPAPAAVTPAVSDSYGGRLVSYVSSGSCGGESSSTHHSGRGQLQRSASQGQLQPSMSSSPSHPGGYMMHRRAYDYEDLLSSVGSYARTGTSSVAGGSHSAVSSRASSRNHSTHSTVTSHSSSVASGHRLGSCDDTAMATGYGADRGSGSSPSRFALGAAHHQPQPGYSSSHRVNTWFNGSEGSNNSSGVYPSGGQPAVMGFHTQADGAQLYDGVSDAQMYSQPHHPHQPQQPQQRAMAVVGPQVVVSGHQSENASQSGVLFASQHPGRTRVSLPPHPPSNTTTTASATSTAAPAATAAPSMHSSDGGANNGGAAGQSAVHYRLFPGRGALHSAGGNASMGTPVMSPAGSGLVGHNSTLSGSSGNPRQLSHLAGKTASLTMSGSISNSANLFGVTSTEHSTASNSLIQAGAEGGAETRGGAVAAQDGWRKPTRPHMVGLLPDGGEVMERPPPPPPAPRDASGGSGSDGLYAQYPQPPQHPQQQQQYLAKQQQQQQPYQRSFSPPDASPAGIAMYTGQMHGQEAIEVVPRAAPPTTPAPPLGNPRQASVARMTDEPAEMRSGAGASAGKSKARYFNNPYSAESTKLYC